MQYACTANADSPAPHNCESEESPVSFLTRYWWIWKFRNLERGVRIFGLPRSLLVTPDVRTKYLEATLGLVKCLEISHEAKNLLLVQDKNMHVKCNEMVPSPLLTMQVYLRRLSCNEIPQPLLCSHCNLDGGKGLGMRLQYI